MSGDRTNIDAVKAAASIEDVMRGRGVELRKSGASTVARCPFHDDSTPSMVVDVKKGVWKCHGPCDVGGDVIRFVELKDGVSFAEALRSLAKQFNVELKPPPDGRTGSERRVNTAPRRMVAEYVYTEADGEVVQFIERWEPGRNNRGKDFLQRVPMKTAVALFDCEDCGAKKGEHCEHASRAAKKNPHQVLLNLPLLKERAHEVVYIFEGEKCCQYAALHLGVLTTTHAGGSNQHKLWTKDFAAPLTGRRVVVIPDNDAGGKKIADHIAGVLKDLAAEVRVLHLPLKEQGDDVVEWIVAGGTKAELQRLTEQAPIAGAEGGGGRKGMLCTRSGEVRPTVGNALKVLQDHEMFRGSLYFDERALAVFVERKLPWEKGGEKYPRVLNDDDAVFGAAWCETALETPVSSETFGKAIWATARQRRRNPLKDWLNSLVWDGIPRCDSWLIRHAGSKDTVFVRAVSKAWMISAAARALDPGCKVDHVLVLEGKQGMRKSSMLAALAGPGNFADNIPDVDSKDTALILGRTWILELAELESMRKSEVTQMNAFVTRTEDVFRPPYDRSTIIVPRRCVFAATTNEETYLRDTTGARRWWPVHVERIDLEAIVAEREQLWAEAVARWRSGEPFFLAGDEVIGLQRQETAEREQVDPWEDTLAPKIQGTASTTLADCFQFLGLDRSRQGPNESKRVAQVLRRLGWVRRQARVGGRREWHYYPPESGPEPGWAPAEPVTTEGGAGVRGDGPGDSGDDVCHHVTTCHHVFPRGRARAPIHADGEAAQRPIFSEKVCRSDGDSGDSGDARRQTVSPGLSPGSDDPNHVVTADGWDGVDGLWGPK